MKIKIITFLLLAALFPLAGCAVGVGKLTINKAYSIPPSPWKKIAVLPFSGGPEFRRVAGEWLAFYIQKQSHYDIVSPTLAEIELGKQGMDLLEKEFTVEEAQKAGKLLGADAVITGKVGVRPGMALAVSVEVQLIETQSGEIVVTATGLMPDPPADVFSKEILAVLNELAEGKLESGS